MSDYGCSTNFTTAQVSVPIDTTTDKHKALVHIRVYDGALACQTTLVFTLPQPQQAHVAKVTLLGTEIRVNLGMRRSNLLALEIQYTEGEDGWDASTSTFSLTRN